MNNLDELLQAIQRYSANQQKSFIEKLEKRNNHIQYLTNIKDSQKQTIDDLQKQVETLTARVELLEKENEWLRGKR